MRVCVCVCVCVRVCACVRVRMCCSEGSEGVSVKGDSLGGVVLHYE